MFCLDLSICSDYPVTIHLLTSLTSKIKQMNHITAEIIKQKPKEINRLSSQENSKNA